MGKFIELKRDCLSVTESYCDLREDYICPRSRHLLLGAVPPSLLYFLNGLEGLGNNNGRFTAYPPDHFQSMAASPLILLDCHTVIFNPSFEAELPAAVISIPPGSLNSTGLSSRKNISII